MPLFISPPFATGTVVGPYRIANVPGDGAVAEAIEISTQRRVALKRLPESLIQDSSRFADYRRLIERLVELRLPGVIGLRGIETCDGVACLVMEFAARGSLVNQIATIGRLPWLDASRRIIEAARTIDAAHAQGIVHGGIRPSNLLLNEHSQLRVADFSGGCIAPRTGDYSAPEVMAGETPSVASDVYSLGAAYFALLAGHAPFDEAADEAALAHAHASDPIPNVRAGIAEIPLRCDAIVRRAMAKRPEERYPSVAALRADLEAAARPERSDDPRQKVEAARRLSLRRASWFQSVRSWLPSTPWLVLVAVCIGAYLTFPLLKTHKAKSTEKSADAPPVKLPTFTNAVEAKFIRVPAGVFSMGDPLLADAKPRLVRITLPFFMGATEVTQREFKWVMNSNPSRFVADENPVDSVTWAEAREYCERLSQSPIEKNAGRIYRLPTEAEWEYCCRAGTRTHFSFGGSLRTHQANLRTGGLLRSTPASTYPANPWGFFDLHGNLWEWCSDWYKSDYFTESPVEDPQGPPTGHRRVLRGGSWNVGPEDCLSGRRYDGILPDERNPEVGFRVVCIVTDLEAANK